MQTYSEEMRGRPLGQFSVRRDRALIAPTMSWRRKPFALPALPARDAVIASALAAEPRASHRPARLRRHAPGIRLPSVWQAGRLTRTMPRPGGISLVSSHEGCKLFALIPCST
jgi:hypothetical protein